MFYIPLVIYVLIRKCDIVKADMVVNLKRCSFWQLELYDPQGIECDYRCVHWSYDRGNNCESAREYIAI